MNTCRLCKKTNYESSEELLKYGTRHYAHGSCGLARWGKEFLSMIPAHQIGLIPYRVIDASPFKDIAMTLYNESQKDATN